MSYIKKPSLLFFLRTTRVNFRELQARLDPRAILRRRHVSTSHKLLLACVLQDSHSRWVCQDWKAGVLVQPIQWEAPRACGLQEASSPWPLSPLGCCLSPHFPSVLRRFPCPGGKELSGPLSMRADVVVSRGHPMRGTGWAKLLEAVPQPMGKPKSVGLGYPCTCPAALGAFVCLLHPHGLVCWIR